MSITRMYPRRSALAALLGLYLGLWLAPGAAAQAVAADTIITNARVTTLDAAKPSAEAVAIKDGKIIAVGATAEMAPYRQAATVVIDAGGRRLIPGLNDSHSHYLRGGTSFSAELRWDGVPTLRQAIDMVRVQARRTPDPEWVRVVGGFTPWQFAEHRLPTPDELSAAAPSTPVFVQYFYSVIVLNKAAIKALNLTRDTPEPVGGTIERDANGDPTGVVRATPDPGIFYSLLAKLPKLEPKAAANSTQQLFQQLARFGLTSVIDAGGGGFTYPDDYATSVHLVQSGKLPLRVSFYLFAQHPGKEFDDYQAWIKNNKAGDNLDQGREHGFELEGAGEWVLWKAGDFENFRSPRPVQDAAMESELEAILTQFVKARWPFRIHATYDESISRILTAIEAVNARTPLNGLRWAIDHAETVKPANMSRIAALGGGIAIQDRMYFLGDDFVTRYGAAAGQYSPPVRRMLKAGIAVGMGTDATRSSFNPWVGLYFLTTGKVASGRTVLSKDNVLSREEALAAYSVGSAWFSQEETVKGRILPGQYADVALLSADYMTVKAAQIRQIESVLTMVGGKVVYAAGEYAKLAPPPLPVEPAWSPLTMFGSYYQEPAPRK
ncbi:amidohydrolase [Rugamonas sp.]|uniref:amidohydrolase n=1 Tax=Rugamonas sp. TaxID=1926287 RepID=UPI0025F29A98|nr:amidohydrolase [Rugamonas sp.]